LQEQWDLDAGEDFVVNFQQAVKGHTKKASVCGKSQEWEMQLAACSDHWAPAHKMGG
jgi:hypothetical protein